MPSQPPPESLKGVVHLLKHALQLRQAEPVMAYYTKLYALQQAIAMQPKGSRDEAAKRWLIATMDELEQEKRKLGTVLEQEGMGRDYVEKFATRVFAIADDEDRAGNAHKGTAQSFFASATFFDVLSQFGELSAEQKEKQRYARWKAADINKALKAGVRPTPGPPGGSAAAMSEDAALEEDLRRLEAQQQQQQQGSAADDGSMPMQHQPQLPPPSDFPDFPTVPSQPQAPPPPMDIPQFPTVPSHPQQPQQPPAFPAGPPQQPPKPKPLPQQPRPAPAPAPIADVSMADTAGAVDPDKVQAAQKHCKYAASALNFDDVPTAVKNLLLALTDLTGREFVPRV